VTRNNESVLFEVGHWNGYNVDNLTSIYERASLVPAAAVIPALVIHRIIVAVKKFIVGLLNRSGCVLTGVTHGRYFARLRLRTRT
jgi:hypothetical protein